MSDAEDNGPIGPPVTMTEESVRGLIRQEVAAALREALTPGPPTHQPPSSSPPASGESMYVVTVWAHSPKRVPFNISFKNPRRRAT